MTLLVQATEPLPASSTPLFHQKLRVTTLEHCHQNFHFVLLLDEEHTPNFLIYIDGWTKSLILVFKFEHNVLVECAHSLVPPKKGLIHATSGILTAEDTDEPNIIVCGGDDSNSNAPNENCMMLSKNEPSAEVVSSAGFSVSLTSGGFLNADRTGSASLVIDNGRTLWVTGGFIDDLFERGRKDTEFLSIAKVSQGELQFPTNGAGPELPNDLYDHCLNAIGPEVAILTGGRYSGTALKSSWSIDLKTMDWHRPCRI